MPRGWRFRTWLFEISWLYHWVEYSGISGLMLDLLMGWPSHGSEKSFVLKMRFSGRHYFVRNTIKA